MLRNIWLPLGWLWVALVFFLSLTPHPPEPISFDGLDKLEHALAYALLMLWFCQVYVTQVSRIRLLFALLVMGMGIEVLQGMSGYRYFEYADMLANASGVLVGWGLARTALGRVLEMLENNGK
jgi:VanZ family protein